MTGDLYSSELSVRYKATAALANHETGTAWPMGCGGAANAFLVLLGSSMGRAGKGQEATAGGAERPRGNAMNLGPEAMEFDWGDHRKARWTRLCAAILGSEPEARALTALINLDWRHSTNEKDIPEDDLTSGWRDHIWPLLPRVQPRVICALTNCVWNIVTPTAQATRVQAPPFPFALARDPIAFQIPGVEFETLLVKPHNHPSRPLSNAQIDDLGAACRWWLSQSSAATTAVTR